MSRGFSTPRLSLSTIGLCLASVVTFASASTPSPIRAQQPADAGEGDEQIWVEPSSSTSSGGRSLSSAAIASLVERASPAVVNVIVSYGDADVESLLRRRSPAPSDKSGMAQGSGVLIHPSGYILTNHHVVEGAEEIKIRLRDRSEYRAEVVGVDPKTDIALMAIDAERSLPALPLGDSEEVRVGDLVVAIGNPLGLHHTVTAGIVSGLGRRDLGIKGRELETDFIQTDASINPGNSGGPLVSLQGEVVGINTAMNRRGQGIGFAIPINLVKDLLPQLHDKGYVVRSWLGARVQKLTATLARSFGLDEARGALVTEVVDDSPADRGGMRAGDVITHFAGHRVRSSQQLPWIVSTTPPNRTVDAEYVREGTPRTLQVTLEKHPDQSKPDIPDTSPPADDQSPDLAIRVKDLDETLARQLGARSTDGAVVAEVGEGSPAREAGLRSRDVVTRIDREPIEAPEDFRRTIDAIEAGELVRLKLVRGGRILYIAFER